MADIAAEAGAAKPKLYRHFADKSALLDAVGERIAAILWERLSIALDPRAPVNDLITGGLQAYLGLVEEYPAALYCCSTPAPRSPRAGASPARSAPCSPTCCASSTWTPTPPNPAARYWPARSARPPSGGWNPGAAMPKHALIDYLATVVWGATDAILRKAGVTVDPDQTDPMRSDP